MESMNLHRATTSYSTTSLIRWTVCVQLYKSIYCSLYFFFSVCRRDTGGGAQFVLLLFAPFWPEITEIERRTRTRTTSEKGRRRRRRLKIPKCRIFHISRPVNARRLFIHFRLVFFIFYYFYVEISLVRGLANKNVNNRCLNASN